MYLLNRNGFYYFRIRLKNKELKFSLHTTSLVHAKQKAKKVIEYMAIKYKNLDKEGFVSEIQSELKTYIDKALVEYSELEDLRHESLKIIDQDTIKERSQSYFQAIYDTSKLKEMETLAKEVLQRSSPNVKEIYSKLATKEEKEVFYQLLLKAEKYVLDIEERRIEEFTSGSGNPFNPSSKLWGSPQVTKKSPAPINGNFLGTTAENNRQTYTSIDLKEPFERFMSEKDSLKRHAKTEYEAIIRLLKNFMDETGFEVPFNKEAIRQLEDVLNCYPKNITKYPVFKNKSLVQIVSMVKNVENNEFELLGFQSTF